MNRKQSQAGFTLLEALIAFLVLSIGMLGIASLHALSMKSGKRAIYRTVAMEKAEQLLESVRANAGDLDPSGGGTSGYVASFADSGAICTANCSSNQMALDDIFHWKKDLKEGLPNTADTKASVAVSAAAAPSKLHLVTVTVTWKERSTNSEAGSVQTYTTQANICSGQPC